MGKKDTPKEVWASGDPYEHYVGRWSRLVAQEFVRWLDVSAGSQWIDVGCGTGALSQTIFEITTPKKVKGIDQSQAFVNSARGRINQTNAEFEVGDAQALPVVSEAYDVAVSGLVLNFVPRPDQMLAEMARAVRKDGIIAVYVWDYFGKMQMMRHFWNAAAALDPTALDLDEGRRFPICRPFALKSLFQSAGLNLVETCPIDVETCFDDFEDYWTPFLGGQGPAPGYTMSLSEERRAQLRERIYNSLPFALDGTIPLVARAWAVKGIKEESRAAYLREGVKPSQGFQSKA